MLRLIEGASRPGSVATPCGWKCVGQRGTGAPRDVVIEEEIRCDAKISGVRYSEVYRIPGPLDLTGLMEL